MTRGLNEYHRRALLVTCRHIDRLLAEMESAAGAARSPFSEVVPDLSPVQREVLGGYVAQLRARMMAALATLDIEVPEPTVRASWSIKTRVTMAEIAVDDIRPAALRGYGELDAETADLLERLEADLARTLRRVASSLMLGQDFAARLEQITAAPVDLELLRRLERIIRERGFVEFRGALEALLERLESETYEVAVFGRVSSGKSSLLNAVLGACLLPVGVTPVTAVPTRIVYGAAPRAVIRFADGEEKVVPVEELAAFVSESSNPRNVMRVVRATVETPALALREGLVLVDTPGVGPLARAGARETYAYLPRCDLGVLLVDAAGTIDREDLEVLRLLDESGIAALVVLSKADLLAEPDRTRLAAYVKEQIAAELGLAPPVGLVSAVGSSAQLGRDWFEREVVSLSARGRELARAAAQRKLAALRQGVQASLEAMLAASRQRAAAGPELRLRLESLVREAEGALRDAGRLCDERADMARLAAPAVIKVAARRLARTGGAAGVVLGQALVETAERFRGEVRAPCLEAARVLARVLAQMSELVPEGLLRPEELAVDVVGEPAVERPAALEAVDLRVGRWLARFPSLFERRIAARLGTAAGPAVESALFDLSSALRSWSHATLARLGEQFAAQSEPARGLARRRESAGPRLDPEALVGDLRELEATASRAASS